MKLHSKIIMMILISSCTDISNQEFNKEGEHERYRASDKEGVSTPKIPWCPIIGKIYTWKILEAQNLVLLDLTIDRIEGTCLVAVVRRKSQRYVPARDVIPGMTMPTPGLNPKPKIILPDGSEAKLVVEENKDTLKTYKENIYVALFSIDAPKTPLKWKKHSDSSIWSTSFGKHSIELYMRKDQAAPDIELLTWYKDRKSPTLRRLSFIGVK